MLICEFKQRRLLHIVPDDYCERYCKGIYNETIRLRTCDDSDTNFIVTNEYQLILTDGFLEIKWSRVDPNITNLTPISEERNLKLKDLIVSDTNPAIRGRDYLKQLGVETVTRFEKQLNTFKAIERNVHFLHGPKSLKLNFQSTVNLKEIIDYIKETSNDIKELEINGNIETTEDLRLEEDVFKGKPNITSLTLTGFNIVNLSTKVFTPLVNLQKLVISKCTIGDLTFLSNLQKSLQHLVLETNEVVDIKYFANFSNLKLIKVIHYIADENYTGLICQQNSCNFLQGIYGVKCPEKCLCHYIYKTLELNINCSGRGLSEIPPIPIPHIGSVSLIFKDNNLSHLPTSHLGGYKMLKKLDVSRNKLTGFHVNQLPIKLDYFDISFNQITKINREMIKYIKSIAIFKQTGNAWIVYCDDEPLLGLFKHLKMNILMREAEMRPVFKKLLPVSPEGFIKYLGQHLIRLGERKNEYFMINEGLLVPSMVQKIKDVDIIMSIYKSMEWLHQKLRSDNSEYELYYYQNMSVACPYKCECCHNRRTSNLGIDCRNTFLHNFPDVVPKNLSLNQKEHISHLLELHLSGNNITTVTLDMLPENLGLLDLRNNSLKALDNKVVNFLIHFNDSIEIKLSGNLWNCGCESRSLLSFLRDHESLEYNITLNRCNISQEDCPDKCVCCLDNSTSSSFIVDCRGEKLQKMPKLSGKVTYVDLRKNNITELHPRDRLFIENRTQTSPLILRMLDNPWSCSCKDIENLNFMKSISSSIVDFTDIFCSSGEKLVSIDQDFICPSAFAYYLALAISLLAMIIAINFMICFRQPLLVWFYEHDVCLSLAARRELDESKKFDAFLAFTHKDEALVEEFVEKLEHGRPRFRLCFYLRDWLAGESIADCIGNSVRDSRRIIILMTDNFMKSTWGRLEFRLALHATSKDRCKRLIVVLYPDVKNFESLDSELRTYMVFNTYLERSNPNFWNKLIYSMPHAKLRYD
ncbi:LOW QUALITY PROTEIN: toll-like receptor 4 [Drosophila eugracilis]|uniref:LOW QUALITY PROTEIN: toll-like receptor 4 n=1 Tax=Drosophila eugracilis TaxID=29029 RepID=UPI001BD9BD98|nr:LOW QUALITY PROTEIN: toll-like receptor 4 [Drosophila eugracilis]